MKTTVIEAAAMLDQILREAHGRREREVAELAAEIRAVAEARADAIFARQDPSGRGGWDADRWSGTDRTDEEIEALDVAPTSPECDFEVTWKPEALRQIREESGR